MTESAYYVVPGSSTRQRSEQCDNDRTPWLRRTVDDIRDQRRHFVHQQGRVGTVKKSPWDQRLARLLVRPLLRTPITPNQITAVTLLLALSGAVLFASGDRQAANWGAGLFVLARFLDHFDGELARQTGTTSRFGYHFDYFVGAGSYAALFLAMGLGLSHGPFGNWATILGVAGSACAVIALFLNLERDRLLNSANDGETVGYPGYAGFELEDGIYLLAPITWLGFLPPFFLAAGIGAILYVLWTLWVLNAGRRSSER